MSRPRAACPECGCAIGFEDVRCYRCVDKAASDTPGPEAGINRVEGIRREKPTAPEVVIGDPKTGAAFALGPAPHVHGVWRRG